MAESRLLIRVGLLSIVLFAIACDNEKSGTNEAAQRSFGIGGVGIFYPTGGAGTAATAGTMVPTKDAGITDTTSVYSGGSGSERVPDTGTIAPSLDGGAKSAQANGGGRSDSSGASSTGGTTTAFGTDGTTTVSGAEPPIPPSPTQCPTIVTGTIAVLGQDVQLWVGPAGQPGPMVFYWHGTGSVAMEAVSLGQALNEIQSNGGVVASFTTTTGSGSDTGNSVWFTCDFEMADIVLACAVDQGFIDTRQIFAAGCSAGGLQSSAMVYQRSSYLAASMPNSGGLAWPNIAIFQDPSHIPALMTTHGAEGVDYYIIDFAQSTAALTANVAAKGGFVVNCDHGGEHCMPPAEVVRAQWEFLKAHPFGFDASPYANGLPANFPSYCQIVN